MPKLTLLVKSAYLANLRVLILNNDNSFFKTQPKTIQIGQFDPMFKSFYFAV